MAEAKTAAKEQFFLIYNDKAEQEKLGLESISAIAKHVGVAPKTALSWVKALRSPEDGADAELKKILDSAFKYAIAGKNPAYLRTWLEQKGYLSKSKEENQGDGLSPADYIKIGQQVREALISEYKQSGGMCPICHKSILLDAPVRLDTEPEHGSESEVGSVGISDRPAEPVPV